MRKLAQLAVIVAASVLTIMSAVGGADLLGPAHADGPQCIANATDPCPPQADPPQADPPQLRTVCTGRGAEDRRSSLLASASTPHQRAALTAGRGTAQARHTVANQPLSPLPGPGHTYEAIEPAPEDNSAELSRWLSPHRGEA